MVVILEFVNALPAFEPTAHQVEFMAMRLDLEL